MKKEDQFHTDFWQQIILSKSYTQCIDWTSDGSYIIIYDIEAMMLAVGNSLKCKHKSYDSFARQLRIYGWNRLHSKEDLATLGKMILPMGAHVWKHATLTRNASIYEVRAVRRRAPPKKKTSKPGATCRNKARKVAASLGSPTNEASDADDETIDYKDELAIVKASRALELLRSERLALKVAKESSLQETQIDDHHPAATGFNASSASLSGFTAKAVTPYGDDSSDSDGESDPASSIEYTDTPPRETSSTSASSFESSPQMSSTVRAAFFGPGVEHPTFKLPDAPQSPLFGNYLSAPTASDDIWNGLLSDLPSSHLGPVSSSPFNVIDWANISSAALSSVPLPDAGATTQVAGETLYHTGTGSTWALDEDRYLTFGAGSL